MKKESKFQSDLKKKLLNMFPGCIVEKFDAKQGYPDLLILYKNKWAMLECKKEQKAHIQPNQIYYNNLFNKMSFSRIIFPENEEEVLNELQSAFGVKRRTRSSRGKQV